MTTLPTSGPPGTPPDGTPQPPRLRFSAAESAMRLLVGSALIGGEELAKRLKAWEQQVLQQDRAVSGTPVHDSDRVRYALIGFLFFARQTASKGLDEAVNHYQRLDPGRELARRLDALARVPVLRSVVNPFRSRLDALTRRWGSDIEHLVRIGRIEERNSRSLADKATGALIDEVLAYLAQNPSITDLVQQQGVGLAGEVIDTVRQTSAAADDRMEAVLWRILRRPPRELDAPDGPSQKPLANRSSHTDGIDGATHA